MLLNLRSNGLVQEYVYEIGACLLQLDFEEDLNASSRLHQRTAEAMNLIATRTKLDEAFYSRILVSSCCPLGCKALLYLAVLCKSPAKCVLCRAVLCCAVQITDEACVLCSVLWCAVLTDCQVHMLRCAVLLSRGCTLPCCAVLTMVSSLVQIGGGVLQMVLYTVE